MYFEASVSPPSSCFVKENRRLACLFVAIVALASGYPEHSGQ